MILKISLPEHLKKFVEEHAVATGYGSASEYLRDLIRRDQQRLQLRNMLLRGAEARITGEADEAYFASLRKWTMAL